MEDGFDLSELSDFSRHLLDLAQDRFPAETKQFLRKQGSELNKQTKAVIKLRISGICLDSSAAKRISMRPATLLLSEYTIPAHMPI